MAPKNNKGSGSRQAIAFDNRWFVFFIAEQKYCSFVESDKSLIVKKGLKAKEEPFDG